MSHNCTTRNCFFLRVLQCLACCFGNPQANRACCWNIVAEWSGPSPFSLGVREVCLPKLVGKTIPTFGSNTPDDCLCFRKQCLRTSLPMFRSVASDGWLPSYLAVLPEGRGQWHAPSTTFASQNPALIPWDLTINCEPTHDTATHISARYS